jgi:hypothetical protein
MSQIQVPENAKKDTMTLSISRRVSWSDVCVNAHPQPCRRMSKDGLEAYAEYKKVVKSLLCAA